LVFDDKFQKLSLRDKQNAVNFELLFWAKIFTAWLNKTKLIRVALVDKFSKNFATRQKTAVNSGCFVHKLQIFRSGVHVSRCMQKFGF
jgi:hypothetical protein